MASWLETGPFCQKCGAWCGQLGQEPHVDLYVAHLVEIFREVRRVLHRTGTVWLNLGDSYGSGGRKTDKRQSISPGTDRDLPIENRQKQGFAKQLIGIPWRVALALQADGWFLRSDIIWEKPAPIPSSVRDRPTLSHEHLFLFARSERYFYDIEAIKEPVAASSKARYAYAFGGKKAQLFYRKLAEGLWQQEETEFLSLAAAQEPLLIPAPDNLFKITHLSDIAAFEIMSRSQRLALVTGAAGGIGREIVRQLQDAGFKVVACVHDEEDAAHLSHVPTVIADVSTEVGVEGMFRTVVQDHGAPHILVNNAGVGLYRSITETTASEWDAVMN